MRNYLYKGRILLSFFLILPATEIFALPGNYLADTLRVHSTILNEARTVIIYHSANLAVSEPVQFLYLLDGEYSDQTCKELAAQFADSLSQLVVVGIMNPQQRRDMLYVHAAAGFLDFICTELVPAAEKGYHTTGRILDGHSFCGSFALFALLRKPGFFKAYVATSPTLIMALVAPARYLQTDSSINKCTRLYFSYGSRDMKQVIRWAKKLESNLSAIKFRNLQWRCERLEGKTHANSATEALFSALRWVYPFK